MSKRSRRWQSEIDKEIESHRASDIREGEKERGGKSNRDSYRKTETK